MCGIAGLNLEDRDLIRERTGLPAGLPGMAPEDVSQFAGRQIR